MRAAVIYEPGGPEVLKLEDKPIPQPVSGQVLIRVRAFGLNRSELFTRQGYSPNVKFPRILGIGAVGTVEESPGGSLTKGDVVATTMGGMGRDFACLGRRSERHRRCCKRLWGSLFRALALEKNDRLLVRGGTTSVGLAAASFRMQ